MIDTASSILHIPLTILQVTDNLHVIYARLFPAKGVDLVVGNGLVISCDKLRSSVAENAILIGCTA